MNLLEYRNRVVIDIDGFSPSKVKVETHPGRFNLAELKRYAAKAPCYLVAILAGVDDDLSELTADLDVTAYILTRYTKGLDQGDAALQMVSMLAQQLKDSKIGGPDANSPSAIKFSNLYNGDLDDVGVALWAVTWKQTLSMDHITPAGLGSFQKLYADIDIAGDGLVEAQSQQTFEGS